MEQLGLYDLPGRCNQEKSEAWFDRHCGQVSHITAQTTIPEAAILGADREDEAVSYRSAAYTCKFSDLGSLKQHNMSRRHKYRRGCASIASSCAL